MKILFFCPWSSKKKWLKHIKLKFKEHRIYTLQDLSEQRVMDFQSFY